MGNPLYDTMLGKHLETKATFLRFPDAHDMPYGMFLHRTAQIAHALRDAGLSPGDRLAAQVQKSACALCLYTACLQAGVVFLPLNTSYTVRELSYFIEDSGAKALVCDQTRLGQLTGIAAHLGAAIFSLNADGTGTLMQEAHSKPETFPTVDRDADDLAALLYTSGTTGRSKGAMLTHRNLLSNAETLVDFWRFTADDVLLHALPIFHTHGLFVATNITLLAGGSMVFLRGFDLDQIIADLPRCTTMMGVPTFYTRLLDDPRLTRDLVDHMRLFISGSAPLLSETHERFENRTGHRILERYGMTETSMNTSNPYDGDRRAGTVGFPLPSVDLRITDRTIGTEVEPGEVGQIEVRGPNVFKGYWNKPGKTAEELREDGFFITGDLGRVDADGYVHIVGRDKDLIISGGYNIYPKEVEMALDSQPGVLESAVIGVPHPDFGETAVGLIVPSKGEEPDLDRIKAGISDALARFKQPRSLIVVDALPRNTMGKVQKAVLRDEYKGLFTTS